MSRARINPVAILDRFTHMAALFINRRSETTTRAEVTQARDAVARLIKAARALEARGFFRPSACADAETRHEMTAMRRALAGLDGDA